MKSFSEPLVAVVILNWKRPDHTLACLKSILSSEYPRILPVVVDNGSLHGCPELMRKAHPGILLIENGRNLGFAGGSNVGIARAMALGADYVMLLNDDAEVAPDMVGQLVRVGESDPRIGILGPRIYYHDHSSVVWSAGGAVSEDGEPRHLRVNEMDDGRPQAPFDADYVTGCVMLAKREVVEEVGGLDERFFAYFEETEWCARARRAGFRVMCVPQAQAWHKIEQSARNHSPRYLYLMTRNRLLYLRCTGAGFATIIRAAIEVLRGVASYSLHARGKDMGSRSTAVLRGVCDFALGRFGAPPAQL